MRKLMAIGVAAMIVSNLAAECKFLYLDNGDGTITLKDVDGHVSGELVIPATYDGKRVTAIGDGIAQEGFMRGNATVKAVDVSDGILMIGRGAFQDCTGLKKVHISGTVKDIGYRAFRGCENLSSLTLEEGIESIGESAFVGCGNLATVCIPSTVSNIGRMAFTINALSSIVVAGRGTGRFSVSDGVLYDKVEKCVICACAKIKHVTLPADCEIIGQDAFNCGWNGAGSQLETVVWPSALKKIEQGAFHRCKKLKSGDFSNTQLELIEEDEFVMCTSLTTVRFPKTLKYLTGHDFSCCTALRAVYFSGDAPEILLKTSRNKDMLDSIYVTTPNLDKDYSDDKQYQYSHLLNVTTYVSAGSKGWGTVPGIWQGCVIQYVCDHGLMESYGPFAPGEKVSLTVDVLVGYAVQGLPSGLKLDKKTGTISGTPKKPTGEAGVTVTFTKKDAETLTAKFIVADWPQVSVACPGLEGRTFTVGVVGDGSGIPVEIEPLSAVKSVKASKLPSGMKLVKDKQTGAWSITGSPKKAGTYNVALTVTTVYGNKQTRTIPVKVEALPSWAIGTFIGMVRQVDYDVSGNVIWDEEDQDYHDWYDVLTTMTVASSGKVSVSWQFPNFTSKVTSGSITSVSDGCYVIEGESVCSGPSEQIKLLSRYVIRPLALSDDSAVSVGCVTVDMQELGQKIDGAWHDVWYDGMQYTFSTDYSYPLLQNVWLRKDIGTLPNLKGVQQRLVYKDHICDFSFGAKGMVAIKVVPPDGKTYSTSGILTLREYREGVWRGEICAIVVYKKNFSGATRVCDVVIDGADITITPREGGQKTL